MFCKCCGKKMIVQDDVSGDIWISCPEVDKFDDTDHELFLVTRDDDGEITIG